MNQKKRIWGWYFFDWASQPYHTVLLTFVFGPFFAAIATAHFAGLGFDEQTADARAQTYWSLCLTGAGLLVGLGAPVLGALADASGRRLPWIAVFSGFYILGAGLLWFTNPDGSNLFFALFAFAFGFVAAEYALIFTNAQLPSLGTEDEIGRISGSGFAFGYAGGLVALILALVFLVEQPSGRTVVGLSPAFGLLDAETREGTRFVGPFIALWFAVFMVPYFLWVREDASRAAKLSFRAGLQRLGASVRSLKGRPSLTSFLGGSMLYRDGLNGLYGFGGTYALLVLNWDLTQVGVFGLVTVISAAILSWVGGRLDRRFGPKPVVIVSILALMAVTVALASISRETAFYMPVDEGSVLPDVIFMFCGVAIGGFGGIVQAASRSLMVRHLEAEAETQGFGLYGLAGRATSFLAPALIALATATTGDVRIGVMPLILLFLFGLLLLRWTKPEGDRAGRWSET
jgi:UMF1 family MFS transporter